MIGCDYFVEDDVVVRVVDYNDAGKVKEFEIPKEFFDGNKMDLEVEGVRRR